MSEPARSEPQRASFLGALPEALLLVMLTAGAYWLAFCYEAGYLSGFGLPTHLVEISLQNTLLMLLKLSGYLYVVYMTVEIVLTRWPKHPRLQFKVFRILCVLLFLLWQLLIYGYRWQRWWNPYLFFVGLLVVAELIWPLLLHRDRGPLRERFIADENSDALFQGRWFTARKLIAFSPIAYRLLVLYIVGGWLVHMAGRAAAETQKEYMVFADAPDFAVVRTYSDTIIAIQFDRRTKAIQSQVIVRKIGTETITLIQEADLGPLEKQTPKVPTKPQNPTHPSK